MEILLDRGDLETKRLRTAGVVEHYATLIEYTNIKVRVYIL